VEKFRNPKFAGCTKIDNPDRLPQKSRMLRGLSGYRAIFM
jgi:hypothetical protein